MRRGAGQLFVPVPADLQAAPTRFLDGWNISYHELFRLPVKLA